MKNHKTSGIPFVKSVIIKEIAAVCKETLCAAWFIYQHMPKCYVINIF